MTRLNPWAGLSAAGLILCGISGCGELVSGANAVPTVSFRSDAAPVEESTETTDTPGDTATADAGGVGTLKGRVIVDGSIGPLPDLFAKGAATKDPSVCGAEAIPDESILVKDGGLANVFIYLEKAPKGTKSPDPMGDVKFDQKTCIFLPHALIVRTKQVITVLNDDAAAHNTHTYPKKNATFNSVVQPNDRNGVPLKYDQTEKEPVSVGCDIHPWMQAYHLPLDHAFAAVSQADGSFVIENLPAGKHEFKVWHEVGRMLEKSYSVTVQPGDNEVTIKVAASKLGK